MRILHVIPSVSAVHGGPSMALVSMEAALSARGIEVVTATTDDDGPGRRLSVARQGPGGGGVPRHHARKWTEFYKVAPGLAAWLLRHVREFDVVHIHALFSFSSAAAALAARAARVPYVVRPLGTLAAYGVTQRRPWLKAASFRLIERGILRQAAAVHFTSQAEWDEAKALGVAMRGVIVPLGVAGPGAGTAIASPLAMPLATPGGNRVVLFLSRLDAKKNVEGLLAAFAGIARRHSDVRLVIAGDGPAGYVEALKDKAAGHGIAERVVWTGHIEGAQKWAALAAADVFVLPSFSENFGIAAAEAMLAGKACVLGRGVAIAGAAAAAGAAIAVAPEPEAIGAAIDRLLGSAALRAEMGAAARRLAEAEFSAEAMGARLHALYASIAAGRSGLVPRASAA